MLYSTVVRRVSTGFLMGFEVVYRFAEFDEDLFVLESKCGFHGIYKSINQAIPLKFIMSHYPWR
jgi:hypothetical protein